jgi:hypothetical protein
MATSGDFLLAITGDFFMAMDSDEKPENTPDALAEKNLYRNAQQEVKE